MHKGVDILLKLLDRQGPGLHALLTRITFREDVAEDLMQELFIKLAGSKNLDKVGNLAAYARATAINLAFDWRRKEMKLNTCSDEYIEHESEEKAALLHLIEREQLQIILDAAQRLSKTHRRVFVMRYLEQNSFEQIAQEVGKTPHHVRAIASRALSRVRDICSKTQGRSINTGGDRYVAS